MGDVSDDVSIESFSFDELATSLPENRRPLDENPSISGERTLEIASPADSADEGIECSEETFFDDEPSARPLGSRVDDDLRDATPRDDRDDRGVGRMTTRGAARGAPPPPPPEPRYRGVSANKDRWQARIKCGGYQEYIGTFDEKRDAAKAYDARVRALGLDVRLNFPDEHGPAPPRIKPRAPRREALARARATEREARRTVVVVPAPEPTEQASRAPGAADSEPSPSATAREDARARVLAVRQAHAHGLSRAWVGGRWRRGDDAPPTVVRIPPSVGRFGPRGRPVNMSPLVTSPVVVALGAPKPAGPSPDLPVIAAAPPPSEVERVAASVAARGDGGDDDELVFEASATAWQ